MQKAAAVCPGCHARFYELHDAVVGEDLVDYVQPHVYFHCVTSYDILLRPTMCTPRMSLACSV